MQSSPQRALDIVSTQLGVGQAGNLEYGILEAELPVFVSFTAWTSVRRIYGNSEWIPIFRISIIRANGYACDKRSPFQNLSRNLFPPRRFSPPDESAGSRAQRDNRHIVWYLACTTPSRALRAVVRCSQVPRWGQTKEMYYYYYYFNYQWT
jgi:hypothetical protein